MWVRNKEEMRAAKVQLWHLHRQPQTSGLLAHRHSQTFSRAKEKMLSSVKTALSFLILKSSSDFSGLKVWVTNLPFTEGFQGGRKSFHVALLYQCEARLSWRQQVLLACSTLIGLGLASTWMRGFLRGFGCLHKLCNQLSRKLLNNK